VSRQVKLGRSDYTKEEISYMESRSMRYGAELARIRSLPKDASVQEEEPDPEPDLGTDVGESVVQDSEQVDGDDADLWEMTAAELRKELGEMELSTKGNKPELVARLAKALSA